MKKNIEAILRHAGAGHMDWSLQGFGMFRAYLSHHTRLHLWDSRFAIPGVSVIHDHPWDFHSCVVAGQIENRMWWQQSTRFYPATHMIQSLVCGPGGGPVGEPVEVALLRGTTSTWKEGDVYSEQWDWLHESVPEDGTVTLVTRKFRRDTEHANVCWPIGEEWVSAEPRPATPREVEAAIDRSLERWF